MAFKLSKTEETRRDDYVMQLNELAGKVQDEIAIFNAAVDELKNSVEAALAAYNEVLVEAGGFAEDIASTADGEFDDKSERWQEGDKASEAREWIDAWQGIDFGEIEFTYPEALDDFEPEHATELDALPSAAGE